MMQRNLVFCLFALCSIAFGMHGCNGNGNSDEIEIVDSIDTISNNKLDEIESFLAVEPTSYSLDSSKDTLLTCEKGTQLFFPANCFAFADLSEITETIEITVKECYEYADFIGENLTTTSNGGLLETGGMINISATSEGKEIAIKPDASYKIYFPKNGNDQEMELFYGVHDSANNINWNLAEEEASPLVPASPSSQTGLTLPAGLNPAGISTTCEAWINSHSSRSNDKLITWEFQNGYGDVFSYVKNNFILPLEMQKELCQENLIRDVEYELKFTKDGLVESIDLVDSNNPALDSLSREFIATWPAMDMTSMAEPKYSSYKYILGFGTRLSNDYHGYSKSIEEQYDIQETLVDIDESDLKYYVMGTSQLGWINCDRFWNSTETKEDVYVNCGNDNPLTTYLIFENVRSIMNGIKKEKQQFFSQIPLNTAVKIIGIQNIEGQPQLCIQNARTSGDEITLNNFQPFSLADLKAEINAIN